MSKPSANPFFETDFSKFMDVSKFMDFSKMAGDFRPPNVEALMASHRKNLETMAAINQAAFESAQGLMRSQADFVRQSLEEATQLINAVMSSATPEEKVIRQAELSKAAVDKCIANVREIAETVARSNSQTIETVSNRMSEGLEEFRDLVKNGRAAA